MYFRENLVILSPLKRAGTFILTNLNVILPKMIWAKLGWNCLSGSKEEGENVKKLKSFFLKLRT